MNIDFDPEVEKRYIETLDERAREAFEKALVSTAHYMLSLRNGACFRYEREILEGVVECSRSAAARIIKRKMGKRDE